ncbi:MULTISPECIES: hypothetical protein [Amycolatopsis]|uniref:Uncharacterized protein n=2 Tax=Amycolatopsis TaxID=1813 RepID=A0A1I3ZAJ4_9PSEU|nr:hypothetical protein [Amycolatopsis sacchari]SFK40940.1 hypothetical protein SAMN05421835_12090 [Amycolatopsis sacchari]
MFELILDPRAVGTPVETLHKLVGAAGFVVTVSGTAPAGTTERAILTAAPRLAEDRDIRTDGLSTSRIGMYRVFWGVVPHPSGSLALLVPLAGEDGWVHHFRVEVLDPVQALAQQGYSTGGGGNGAVTDAGFAQAFRQAGI